MFKPSISRITAAVLLVGPLVTCLAGCGRGNREAWPQDQTSLTRDPAEVMVTVAPVTIRPVQRTIEAVGTVYGYEEVSISTKVEGRVLKILHDVADRVKPGEALLEIDPTDYDLAVRESQRALEVELAKLGFKEVPKPGFDVTKVPSVVQASLRMENAKARMERIEAARSSSSKEEVAERETEYRVAQAEYDNQVLLAKAGVATVQMKQEDLDIARQHLKDTAVFAPVPSLPVPGGEHEVVYAITQRAVAEGSYVKSGVEVFKLVIDRPLKLRVEVPERHTGEIQLRQKAEVFTPASALPVEGTVTRINPAVDPVTRTFEVEILVPNSGGELKPGSFAKAAILTRLDLDAATVPIEAPISFAGITKVFLAEDGKAREVPVTLGVQGTEWVEIVTQTRLPDQAMVVTSGQTLIADGTPVGIRGAPNEASGGAGGNPEAPSRPSGDRKESSR